MNNMQKVGAYASFVIGVAFVAILVLVFGLLPAMGVKVPEDFTNPQAATKIASVLPIFNLLDLVFGFTTVLVALALRERLQNSAPNQMRLAVIAASIAGALFIGTGIAQFYGWPILLQNPPAGAAANAAFFAIATGLENAAIFAAGWVTLLWGWAGLSTKGLPSALNYVFILAGILSIVGVVSPLISILSVVADAIWAFWLGVILMPARK